jgi:hypothetical protein
MTLAPLEPMGYTAPVGKEGSVTAGRGREGAP